MCLLNVETHQLEEFLRDRIPPYAILSHAWGEEEVTFQDLQHPSHGKKPRIRQNCTDMRFDTRDGVKWVWVDTCCIDKFSSAELPEAINSMFEWYRRAQVCYVFLADAPSPKPGETLEEAFRNARWLTRGWALQEFLAPGCIKLFNSAWRKAEPSNFPSIFNHLESDDFELKLLHHFTTIDRHNWRAADVHTRLSWAASRQTSRREDMAYCLLGFLDVKMPLLYGEATTAFSRLLEEVIKQSNSHGVLAAWYGLPSPSSLGGLLPESPRPYAGYRERGSSTSGSELLGPLC
ncbi:heterokaryon incompatibility protein-domain-containing protein [Ustulina deusta]|nr:heterokaryon incompatibility protein-domain-containing protein [Ustulina deusta]